MAQNVFQDVITFQAEEMGQIKSLCPVEGKTPYTVVIFKFKKGKHFKKGKLFEKEHPTE